MASNINVSVTADTTKLRAQLALAQADLRQYQATLKAAATDIKASGAASEEQSVALSKAAASMNTAKAEVASLRTQLGEIRPAAEEAGQGINHGITREIMVLAHELSQGNINKVSGSIMVLGERVKMTGALMMGAVGGAALLARQLFEVAGNASKAAAELRGVANVAVLRGQNGVAAMANAKIGAERMASGGDIGAGDAQKIANAIENLGGASAETKKALTDLGVSLNLALGNGDAEETAKKLGEAFHDTNSLKAFVEENNLLTESQKRSLDQAMAVKDAYGAQRIAMDALKARLAPAQKEYTDTAWLKDLAKTQLPYQPGLDKTLSFSGTPAPSAEDQQVSAIEEEHLGKLREEEALQGQLEVVQHRLASETDTSAKTRLQSTIQDIQAQQAMLKARGDSSWEQKQELAIQKSVTAAEQGAKTRQQAELAAARATIAGWEQAAQSEGLTEQQKTMALSRAESERQRIRMMELSQGAAGAKEGVQAQIAALSAQQAADTKNYDSWMALEQQKLGILRQAYGERSAQYQEELRREMAFQQQFAAQKGRMDLESVQRQNEQGQIALRGTVQNLQTEVASHRMTREQEVTLARQAIEEEERAELSALDAVIAGLQKGTEAYQKAMDARQKLALQLNTQLAQNAREQAQVAELTAAREEAVYRGAFENISSSASGAFAGYISGSSTLVSAQQQVGRTILSSFTSMTSQMAARWLATQLANALASEQTQVAVAAAQEQGQSGLWTLLTRSLGLWTATEGTKTAVSTAGDATRTASAVSAEGTKTAATVSGNAARTAANSAAEATENSWFIVRAAKWIASELGLTAATETQAATRVATQSAASAATAAEASATNVAAAMSYAAVGGVAAGQSVAAIPFVGWAMAPGVATSTYAELAAMGSMAAFAQGSWDVPKDMVAQIHAGEMIVPKTFAQSLRDSSSGRATTNNADNRSASINATYAPTFHGTSADLRGQSARQFEEFKSYVTDLGRNGRLALPGR